MSFVATPSLASATSTRLDSACKHIQQCRVSYDHMLDFVEDANELEKEEMKYCVHKDELVVGVGRPWKEDCVRKLPISAYPRVISNMGDITKRKTFEYHLKMIKYLYHFSTSLLSRGRIIHDILNSTNDKDKHRDVRSHYLDTDKTQQEVKRAMSKMNDFYPVGVANTLGYAHPNSGDTMSSVMIGGLRTVMNGDFEVYAGDKIQWYWSFERNCFRDDGSRKSIVNRDGEVLHGMDPEEERLDDRIKGSNFQDIGRKRFNDLQYGATNNSKSPSDKAEHVARIKPYIRDDEQPRIYDWSRVFAVAISSARPNEMVDIKICRQSL